MRKSLENIATGFRAGALAVVLSTGAISGTNAENNSPQAVELSMSNAPPVNKINIPQVTELSMTYAPFVYYEGHRILVPREVYIKPNMHEIKNWILNHGKGEFHLAAKFMSDNGQEVNPTYLIGKREKGSRFYGASLVGKKSNYVTSGSKPFIPSNPEVLFDNLSFTDVLGSINPFGIFTGNLINVQSLMSKLDVELKYAYHGYNVFIHLNPDKNSQAQNNDGYYKSKANYFTVDGGPRIHLPSH